MGISREIWDLRDGTPPNKKKHQQTRDTPFEQGKRLSINKKNTFQARKCLSSKGYLPIKCKSLQVVGVSRQGKVVVSDGGYCLLVWGDAKETKEKRGGRWRGVGPLVVRLCFHLAVV